MNQIQRKLRLIDLTEGNSHPFGNTKGRQVFTALHDQISAYPDTQIFEISLKGILATDASFPRESVISVAKQLRGEKWFCLTDFDSQDLLDNWDYAASAKQQPIVVWEDDGYKLIGSNLKPSGVELFDCVISSDYITTAEVARKLNISVQNASTRLKKLMNDGIIMRLEDTADSGGVEFIYKGIKKSP